MVTSQSIERFVEMIVNSFLFESRFLRHNLVSFHATATIIVQEIMKGAPTSGGIPLSKKLVFVRPYLVACFAGMQYTVEDLNSCAHPLELTPLLLLLSLT
jgi:hypothetical protein